MALHMSSSYSAVKHFISLPAVCGGGVTAGQVVMVVLNVPLQLGVGYRFYRSAFLGNIYFLLFSSIDPEDPAYIISVAISLPFQSHLSSSLLLQ
jgi:hypothetical protein